MQIRCRSCGKDVPAEDVNLDKGLAKCRACHAVFDFSGQVKTAAAPKRNRGEIPMPANLVVAESPTSLAVVRRWGRGPAIFLIFFAGFWNLVVSVFVVAAASGTLKDEQGQRPGAFIWLFLAPFILVGAGTAYVALAFLLNRTTIKVEGTALTVTHGPIRWPGARTLDAAQIHQLYCTEYVAYRQNNVPQYRLVVNALMLDGSRLKLIKGVEDAGQALYLEQLLERHLGIEDRPVREEYQGGHLD